jgi:hypothetical protein
MNKIFVWVTKVEEYYLTIKPTSLVRGHGLCKLMAESKDSPLDNTGEASTTLLVSLIDPWFSNVAYLLTYGEFPPNMSHKER